MTTLSGGLRTRSILESIYQELYSELDALNWFDAARENEPIRFVMEPQDRDTEIKVNTLALVSEDADEVYTGLGELSVEETATYYVDFYAQSNALGLHLIDDIRDIIMGRMGNRTHPRFTVYDWTQATPSEVGVVQVQNMMKDKARNYPKPWLKHWYMLRFEVVDYVDSE